MLQGGAAREARVTMRPTFDRETDSVVVAMSEVDHLIPSHVVFKR